MQTGLGVCVVSDSLLLFSSIKMIFLVSDLSLAYPAVLAREERLWESERKTPHSGVLGTAGEQPAHNETLLSLNDSWGFGDALG